MQTIELGGIKIHVDDSDGTIPLLRELVRPLGVKEAADFLGISERTAARWRESGWIPSRKHGPLRLVDLLRRVMPEEGGGE